MARRPAVVRCEWEPNYALARLTAAVRCESVRMFAVHWVGLQPSFLVLANVGQSWVLVAPDAPTFVAEMIALPAAERSLICCSLRRRYYSQVCARWPGAGSPPSGPRFVVRDRLPAWYSANLYWPGDGCCYW